MIDLVALAAPFPPEAISWRIGSTTADKARGMALAYLDARDVADRLDAVAGPAGWQCRYSHVGAVMVCDIGIKIGDEWLYKADGAGQSDIEAEKGALSDAFKRAAVRWGIGRYLYHLPSPWVEIETRGRTSIIKQSEYAKLEGILAKANAGIPQGKAPPPPEDEDVMVAARRWVSEQRGTLATFANESDVKAWHTKHAKALVKLKGVSEALYGDAMKAYGDTLERAQGGR